MLHTAIIDVDHGCSKQLVIDFGDKNVIFYHTGSLEPSANNKKMLNCQGFKPFCRTQSLLLKVYSLLGRLKRFICDFYNSDLWQKRALFIFKINDYASNIDYVV